MKAGRDLDALVAEKVMGWTRIEGAHPEIEAAGGMWRTPKGARMATAFSTSISAAWDIVEAMRARGYYAEISEHISDPAVRCAMFASRDGYYDSYERCWDNECQVCADTVPLAICLAALRAVGVEVDDAH